MKNKCFTSFLKYETNFQPFVTWGGINISCTRSRPSELIEQRLKNSFYFQVIALGTGKVPFNNIASLRF